MFKRPEICLRANGRSLDHLLWWWVLVNNLFSVRNALHFYISPHISPDLRHATAKITTHGPATREWTDLTLREMHGTNNYLNVAVQLCSCFSDFTGVFDSGNFGALTLLVYWRLTIGVSEHSAGEPSQVMFSSTATLSISTFWKKKNKVMNIYTVTCIPTARQRLCQHTRTRQ
jgi:hypothetical protein